MSVCCDLTIHHVMGLVLLRFGSTVPGPGAPCSGDGQCKVSSAVSFIDASALLFKGTSPLSISVCNIGIALMSQGITEEKLSYPHISVLPVVHFKSV